MSVIVKTGTMKARQKDGSMKTINILVGSESESVKAVNDAGTEQITKIQQKGEQILGQIPENETTFQARFNSLEQEVQDIRNGADGNTYQNAGIAIRTQLQNITDSINNIGGASSDEVSAIAAEVNDIRTGADGSVYESAGEAVRSQINKINADALNNVVNAHMWKKLGNGGEPTLSLGESELITVVSVLAMSGSTVNVTFEYSDSIGINDVGEIELQAPISKATLDTTNTAAPDGADKLNVLGGKYTFIKEECYKIEDNVDFAWETVKGTYFDNSVLRCNAQKATITTSGGTSLYGYVSSTDRNAYPDDGTSGAFRYKYVGCIGEAITRIIESTTTT